MTIVISSETVFRICGSDLRNSFSRESNVASDVSRSPSRNAAIAFKLNQKFSWDMIKSSIGLQCWMSAHAGPRIRANGVPCRKSYIHRYFWQFAVRLPSNDCSAFCGNSRLVQLQPAAGGDLNKHSPTLGTMKNRNSSVG